MNIELQIPKDAKCRAGLRIYDPENDGLVSVLIDIALGLPASCDLIVSGFGRGRWTTITDIDLPLILEQLPDAYAAISMRQSFNLDFYEQHLQRFIQFEATGAAYVATVSPFDGSSPDAFENEQIATADLTRMLDNLRNTLIDYCQQNFPELRQNAIFDAWLKDVGTKPRS